MTSLLFLGKEYFNTYNFNRDIYLNENSSLSFESYFSLTRGYSLKVWFLFCNILAFETNNISNQRALDDNQDLIIKEMGKMLNDIEKQAILANKEFGKVFILV